jgi:glutathione peroxidase-family protein
LRALEGCPPDGLRLCWTLAARVSAVRETCQQRWNFEKFVIDGAGEVVGRFRPKTLPDAPEVRTAIESLLAG